MKSFKTFLLEEHKLVHSFDDVEHGKPVRIQAWHGTAHAETIRDKGFRSDAEIQKHGFDGKMAKSFKHSQGEGNKVHLLGQGVYFADSKNEASKYGVPHKIEVTMHNPYVIDHGSIDVFRNLNHSELQAKGHDGIVVKRGRYSLYGGENYRQAVVFHPHKAKLIDEFEQPNTLVTGSKVRHKLTGQVGTLKRAVRVFQDHHLEFHRDRNPDLKSGDGFAAVKWNASKKLGLPASMDHNVYSNHIELLPPKETK